MWCGLHRYSAKRVQIDAMFVVHLFVNCIYKYLFSSLLTVCLFIKPVTMYVSYYLSPFRSLMLALHKFKIYSIDSKPMLMFSLRNLKFSLQKLKYILHPSISYFKWESRACGAKATAELCKGYHRGLSAC